MVHSFACSLSSSFLHSLFFFFLSFWGEKGLANVADTDLELPPRIQAPSVPVRGLCYRCAPPHPVHMPSQSSGFEPIDFQPFFSSSFILFRSVIQQGTALTSAVTAPEVRPASEAPQASRVSWLIKLMAAATTTTLPRCHQHRGATSALWDDGIFSAVSWYRELSLG